MTMLAARAHADAQQLRLEQIERPEPAVGEVVIKVKSAGLAVGVIAQWLRGMYPILPRTLGNEAAGTIAAVGTGVTDVTVGDRVRLHPNLSCRRCEFCLSDREQLCRQASMIGQGIFGAEAMPLYSRYHHGALAEYVLAPAWAVDPLPDEISYDVAAKVHDVADALHAWKVAAPGPGATVVVTAATGAVGTAMVRLAPLFGVARLILVARSEQRLDQVRALNPPLVETIALEDLGTDWGATRALTRAIRERVPDGPDVLIDFLPEGPGTWQAIAAVKMGGTAVMMGSNTSMPSLPSIAVMINCWRIVGTRNCTRQDARQVMQWLQDGTLVVEDLVTHRFPLSEIAAATRAVLERREPMWMAVVHP